MSASEDDFYGVIKEIIELRYPGQNQKMVVLFCYEWFDPVIDRGMKVHPLYGIVEIRHNRRYAKYDPFIFAQQAVQVYYAPYPAGLRDKSGWWVVIKTKPRGVIDDSHQLAVAYQGEEMSFVTEVVDHDEIDTLRDNTVNLKQMKLFVDLVGEIGEDEEKIGDEEEEDEDEYEGDDNEDEDQTEHPHNEYVLTDDE